MSGWWETADINAGNSCFPGLTEVVTRERAEQIAVWRRDLSWRGVSDEAHKAWPDDMYRVCGSPQNTMCGEDLCYIASILLHRDVNED